jgi:hypothetical protein
MAHQHDRRRTAVPAFTDIRTKGFLTNGGEPVQPHVATHFGKTFTGRQFHAKPGRLAAGRHIGPAAVLIHAIFHSAKPASGTVLLATFDDRNTF